MIATAPLRFAETVAEPFGLLHLKHPATRWLRELLLKLYVQP